MPPFRTATLWLIVLASWLALLFLILAYLYLKALSDGESEPAPVEGPPTSSGSSRPRPAAPGDLQYRSGLGGSFRIPAQDGRTAPLHARPDGCPTTRPSTPRRYQTKRSRTMAALSGGKIFSAS